MICAICWALLFSNGEMRLTYSDPGLIDIKPDGLWAYVCGDGSDVRYVRNSDQVYYELGFWEENK